jgi:hypothetical protein
LFLKLLLRVARLQLVDLDIHVGVGGHQAHLFRPLEHYFVVDHDAQDL